MHLLVVDGNSIVNRAFYGVRLLSTKSGEFTNALFGFLNILGKLRDMTAPDGIAVAFDLPAPTFRHKLYDGYKAGRKPMPEELRRQIPVLKELLRLMGCAVVECEGFEADDILGTLSAVCSGDDRCTLATGDRDALQLVTEQVHVLLAGTKGGQPETTAYTPDTVMEKYGMTPPQLIELKALMGDASDRIPGVAGVGEKTAMALIQQFGSLDGVYAHLDDPAVKAGVRAKLEASRDDAYLSRTLGTICREAPIETDLSQYRLKPADRPALTALLTRLEFFKFIEKWGLTGEIPAPAPAATGEPLVALQVTDVAAVCQAAQTIGTLDLLPTVDGRWLAAAGENYADTPLEPLYNVLADPAVAKRVHDGKTLFAALLTGGCTPAGFVMDTMLAGYLLNPLGSDYSLDRLAREYGVSYAETAAPDARLAGFAALADQLAAAIEEQGQTELLTAIEIPLSFVLADMERIGVEVDREGLAAFGDDLGKKIAALQQGIYDAIGYPFNLNSPKQLGQALFEDLGLPAKKKTKSGYSTNAEVLESLRDAHPAVAMLLDYRMLSKLKSTYCDGLLDKIAADGRIHSSFNQTETRTGRISSTEPNLQNIPVRQPIGREMRRFFRAKKGYRLCDADYSQIELRVLAHMANDETMIDAFNRELDIHRITASQVFDIPEEMVTPLMRSRAKAVNFGIVYGIGAHSLSEDIGVSYGEAKRYIENYLATYHGIDRYMKQLIADAKQEGFAKTLFNRRRPLPELSSSQAMLRAFGERVACNMPIQGTAADIIKIAMVRVHRRLAAEGLDARLLLQIHDELIVEARADVAERATALLVEEMEAAAALRVRLAVDAAIGQTWLDTKE